MLTLLNLEDCLETNFVTVEETYTLKQLLSEAVAKSNRNVFPVVNHDQKLVGIVRLDDIRDIMFDITLYHKVTVATLMAKISTTIIIETDNAKTTMRKFQDSGAWNLPVIKEGKYIGFISKSKLLTAYRRKLISFA